MINKAKKHSITFKFLLKEIALVFLNVFIMIAVILMAGFVYLMTKTPLGDTLYTRNIPQTSIIYDKFFYIQADTKLTKNTLKTGILQMVWQKRAYRL